jgi:hypothetical protein
VCRPKYVEKLRNNRIINSTKPLLLVGSFYEIHRPLYIKRRFINHPTGRILEITLPFVYILNRHTGAVLCEFE